MAEAAYDVTANPQEFPGQNLTLVLANISGSEVDYSENDTTPAFARVIRDIILPIICTCGIIGIILTVIVLSRKNMSTSTNCYLMGLAFSDLFFLIIFGTRLCESLLDKNNGKSYYMFLIILMYATIFLHIFLLMSIWITVMLAIERYIAICQPFLAVKLCNVRNARIFIISIFISCVICRMPNFFEHTITNFGDLYYPEQTEMGRDPNYLKVYPWIVDVIIMSVIPFVLLVVLNVRLIWEVRKSTLYIQQNQGPNNAHAVHREEMQITFMLISVIIVFFICQAPYVIYTAIASINAFQNTQSGMQIFRYIAMLLITLKSAVNFILYCWFSEKFWATLKKIFCREMCLRFRKSSDNHNGSYLNMKRFSSLGNTRVTFITEQDS